jgi:hypothetical protein
MRRPSAVLLACSLVLAALAPFVAIGAVGVAGATVPDARLTFSNVAVAPGTPTVDEATTVTATVQNSAGSDSAVRIDRVRLSSGGQTLADAEGPGSLSPGDSLTVDLTTAFAAAGQKDLVLTAVGEDANNETVRIRRPVSVTVVDGVPDARFSFSNVAVAPGTPATGEPTTVTATVASSAGSPAPATVDRVLLRDGEETLAEAAGPGTLSPGDTVAVDLTTAFARPGSQDLTLVAVGTDADDERVRVQRPVRVPVRQSAPAVDVRVPDPVAGVESRVGVELSNPDGEAISDVTVTVEGGAVDRRTSVPVLAAGATETVNLSVRPERGEQPVTVAVAYTTSTGRRTSTASEVTVTAAPLRADVGVAISRAPQEQQAAANPQLAALLGGGLGAAAGGGGGGSGALQDEGDSEGQARRVAVEVTNFGNAPVADAVVRPRADNRSLPRRFVGDLAPGETGTVTVDLSAIDRSATLVAAVNYTVAGTGPPGAREANVADAARPVRGTARGTFSYDRPAGAIEVTDVALSFTDDGRLLVSGNAGNVGDAAVNGVVVSVGSNEHVTPAYPQRTYFVGTVDGSEFAPFELTADVDAGNASTIPVQVRYVVNGEERTRTEQLPYDRSLSTPDGSDGSLPLGAVGLIAGIVVGLLLAGLGLLARRRR